MAVIDVVLYRLSHACSPCVIKLLITIVVKYATGVRHSVIARELQLSIQKGLF